MTRQAQTCNQFQMWFERRTQKMEIKFGRYRKDGLFMFDNLIACELDLKDKMKRFLLNLYIC